MADHIWGGLSSVLDAEIVNSAAEGTTLSVTDILIAGHSVGGAIGTLLATRIQVRCNPPLVFIFQHNIKYYCNDLVRGSCLGGGYAPPSPPAGGRAGQYGGRKRPLAGQLWFMLMLVC